MTRKRNLSGRNFVKSSALAPVVAGGFALSSCDSVGKRWAGTWFQTRGVICNGFSVEEQFKYDTVIRAELDGPHSLPDEVWITHSAGWLAGIIRLNKVIDEL